MSIFTALKTSTSSLDAQGTKFEAISDNIANSNTDGYKRTDVKFATLVNERITETRFSAGGVMARPRQEVEQRGQIQSTSFSTDMAVSGRGFFIVTEHATANAVRSDEGLAYTRAGSFRTTEEGYLRNAAGYYLQGWTVNRAGQVARDGIINKSPTEFDLEPVNINRIATIAEETNNLRTRLNLPAEFTDRIAIARSLTSQAAGGILGALADVAGGGPPINSIAGAAFATSGAELAGWAAAIGGGAVLNFPGAPGPANLGGLQALVNPAARQAAFTAAQQGKSPQQIAEAAGDAARRAVAGTNIQIDPDGAGAVVARAPTGAELDLLRNNIINGFGARQGLLTQINNAVIVRNTKADFLSAIGVDKALGVGNSPDAKVEPHFTTTRTVYDAQGMPRRVRLEWYRIEQAPLWEDRNADGNVDPGEDIKARPNTWAVRIATNGVDGMQPGLQDFQAPDNGNAGDENRLQTMASNRGVEVPRFVVLAPNAQQRENPINNRDGTVLGDIPDVPPVAARGIDEQNQATAANQIVQTDVLFMQFNGDGSLEGVFVQPDFSNANRVAARMRRPSDTPHHISVAVGRVVPDTMTSGWFGKGTDGTSLVRAPVAGDTDFVTGGAIPVASPFGERGARSLVFNWDIGRPTHVRLAEAVAPSEDFAGTGLDGLTHFDSGESEPTVELFHSHQDGLRAGTVTGVHVQEDGTVIARYDNGGERRIYKVPLASFTNPNGMVNVTGNVYKESKESGQMQINRAGQGVNGVVKGSALERSTVDIANEFSDMIVTQQIFTANTRVISTSDEMLTDVNNMVR